jgi:hypothetical protein
MLRLEIRGQSFEVRDHTGNRGWPHGRAGAKAAPECHLAGNGWSRFMLRVRYDYFPGMLPDKYSETAQ